ncbi:hypothetical protein F4083_10135 [Candidatus Poribacteria bacterium]|nr:hypothetical protein [Candidatus Poribacteria bacterium]MYB64757.1 hypothetical protein [Candidatus Poribacteria bacterium]MYF56332.1 hypothetical protein [Candidatus Poribacteria bacterium]MYI94660.1 hypothetical protein [Candidatus Poribacteria bacterium]
MTNTLSQNATKDHESHQSKHIGVTFRAILIGIILIPPNTYFIMANHLRYWSTLPTTMSLIYNVVITLTLLTGLNFLVKLFLPRFALRQAELLTIYVILSLSSAISGHDMMQTVIPVIPNGFWFATPENEWQQLFWRYLPSWMTLSDVSVLQDFYDGDTTFYAKRYLSAWWEPILWWTLFLSVLIWVMICIDLLLRKQWIEREKLTYPIVRLPIEMTHSDGRLFKSKMLWVGFAIAGGIDLINGIHVFFPVFPEIPVREFNLGAYFTEKPWDAIGWTPIYILSFGVGLAFLMPLEMSFSLWFFYLFWKGERVLGRAMGLQILPGFPYHGPQGVGAYLGIACFALYGGRRHILHVFKNIIGTGRTQSKHIDSDGSVAPEMKDTTNYRWVFAGLVAGILFLFIFSGYGGMAVWMIALYFLIYYLLALGITRVRAEVGPPTHEMFVANPRQFILDAFGSRPIPPQSLTMMSLYYAFNRGYRAHPMPHTLEGFKIAEVGNMKAKGMVIAMMCAVFFGVLAAFWSYLVVSYDIGANPGLGNGGYNRLRTWLYYPSETNVPAVTFMGVGFLFTGLLWWLRSRFPMFPFHPTGYAVASSMWTFGWLWFSVFISWVAKNLILRFGGIRLYHRVMPLFLGLILGEFMVGGAWVIVRLIWGVSVYSFYR